MVTVEFLLTAAAVVKSVVASLAAFVVCCGVVVCNCMVVLEVLLVAAIVPKLVVAGSEVPVLMLVVFARVLVVEFRSVCAPVVVAGVTAMAVVVACVPTGSRSPSKKISAATSVSPRAIDMGDLH